MRPRHLVPLTLLLSALTGCVSHVATYSGPHRASSQVARIPWHESQDQVRVTAVDGYPVTATRATLDLLPGWRTIEVVYTPHNTLQSYPVRVTFRADAGHEYALSAKTIVGQVESGAWAGKYRVAVYNVTAGHEVARSDRRADDYREAYDAIGEVHRPAAGRDYDYQ